MRIHHPGLPKAIGMSYKAAWDLPIDAMNKSWPASRWWSV